MNHDDASSTVTSTTPSTTFSVTIEDLINDAPEKLPVANDNSVNKSIVYNNKSDVIKVDKRKRSSHTEEEWNAIQEKRLTAFRTKQASKKRKLENHDTIQAKLDTASFHLKAVVNFLKEKGYNVEEIFSTE